MNTDGLKTYASLLAQKPADVAIIAAWLAEYTAAGANHNEATTQTRQDNGKLEKASGPYDPQIVAGQVRILSKQYTTDPDKIPYVAVLEEWDKGWWLIAPFSPFNTPATPGEMTTGLSTRGLGALQVWNCRTVPAFLLQKSFQFSELPEKVRTDARALFRHELFGTDLPKSFGATRGAPITLSADPRREYHARAAERLDPLLDSIMEALGEK